MAKINLALLCGGDTPEREVSLSGGRQVFDALKKDRYRVTQYDPKTDLGRLVADAPQIDAALLILHGLNGEDGTIQGLLDLLQIPYQGSGVLGSAVAMDKVMSKRQYEHAGIPVPSYLTIHRKDDVDAGDCLQRIGLPLVVKPATCGSSVGLTIVRDEDQFQTAVEKGFEYDHTLLIEEFIDGLELTVAILGNDDLEALPVIEIIPGAGYDFFDYGAKYTPGATEEICPARIDDGLAATAQSHAKLAHQALGCRGYSRTDLILSDGDLYVLETNTIPGMTATSLFPLAAKTAGISYSDLLDRLIELGIEDARTDSK
jgi:D-alanine-D-alanine ligase